MGGLDDVAIRWFELCDTGKTGQLYLTFALQAQVREGASAHARTLACGRKPCRLQHMRCALLQAWPCHASTRLAMPTVCAQGDDALAMCGLRLLLWADASRIGSTDRHSSDARQAARR